MSKLTNGLLSPLGAKELLPIRPMSEYNRNTNYPQAWSQYAATLTGPVTLKVAGYATTIEITEAQLTGVYFPLLTMLQDLQQSSEKRVIAGLAGIPGSGKTAFTAALTHVAHALFPMSWFSAVGMDGWHLSNQVLDKRTINNGAGKAIPLRRRKGCPESFDVSVLCKALAELHQAEGIVKLPVYDRQRHDPIPEALTVLPQTRVLLVEGNYLLDDNPPWDAVSSQLHPKLFLECDADLARQRVIARHIRGGLTEQTASAKFELNDRANTEIVSAAASCADVRIQLEPEPRIQG
ncbi:MAG: hypothetical protein JSV03_09855 [Planctomycetota bacterium]|nr:MAG: hypothetical protein JSV03_09855 [Planctomycetota bacterium]